MRDLQREKGTAESDPGMSPTSVEVFDAIVPEYLAGLIYGGVCESVASELAARRTAMEAATKQCGER